MKNLLLILLISTLFVSCKPSVNPNEWVVSTATCWNSMTVTKAGSPIPRPRLISTCDRMVILPATEMVADFNVETKFKNRVRGTINIIYQWRISDPITFISSAKSITSAPTDSDKKIEPNALEAVENSVVDKMLMDIIREYTPDIEASDVDEMKIEKDLNDLAKKRINRGIEFSGMSVNVNFSRQTEEALDVLSALRFYESNNEKDFGRKIIEAKAGSANINVETSKQNAGEKDETDK